VRLVCLDLEGVLIPEIWIAFSELTGIPEFRKTTREEKDYNKLMQFRIDLLAKHGLKLKDIQNVIGTMEPLDGAYEFIRSLREKTQVIILSDTFEEFAKPLMAKLNYPTLFCNRLEISSNGFISGFHLRQQNGKKHAVAALKTLKINVFAAGDSYNDLDMIAEADSGCLFRAPEQIRKDYNHIPCVDTFEELMREINLWGIEKS
jgi:phosphoserine/homoserine phosphotransferase